MSRCLVACAVAMAASGQVGCGIADAIQQFNAQIQNAVESFDRSINILARQSADWQVVLQDLEESLVGDVQSTLRVEVTNLLEEGVLAVGGEFRCDAEFVRLRTLRELIRIRNDFVLTVNAIGLVLPLRPQPPVEPYVCSAVPAGVDVSLDTERRTKLGIYGFDLRSLPIIAEVVDVAGGRRNVTSALGIISNFHMVLDLTHGGAALADDSRRIVFSWNQRPQSVVPVLSPVVTPTCRIRPQLVPKSTHIFIPPHSGSGDKDFKGHGPCVDFELSLKVDLEGTEIVAAYSMLARECKSNWQSQSDYTRAKGSEQLVLFKVSNPQERILAHDRDPTIEKRYRDTNHAGDVFPFGGAKPVTKLTFVGDTGGDEAGTETKVAIEFADMEVEVQECTLR